MPRKTDEIAVQFVGLFLKREWKNREFSPDELQIILDTILAAGFDVGAVVPGNIDGCYRDQDGSSTGETYQINTFCQIKALGQDGKDCCWATGWLSYILFRMSSCREAREPILVRLVSSEIERSIPLEPIQLTSEGDLLSEYPGEGYAPDHTRDNKELGCCVGIHKHCHGWVDRRRATETQDVLVCRRCHLRVYFPKETKTYGQLREVMLSKLGKVPA